MLSWAQRTPAPAVVRTECPEKPPGGELVILPCMWAEFSPLSGQAYRPRGLWGWAWRKEQEGGLGLHGGKASSGPGARSEKARERRGKVEGLGQGQGWGM